MTRWLRLSLWLSIKRGGEFWRDMPLTTQPFRKEPAMTSELKPCPFCGGEPFHKNKYWKEDCPDSNLVCLTQVYCGDCNSKAGEYESIEEAQKAWNTRHIKHTKVTEWVCEDHPDKPWGGISDSPDACHCGGAGAIREKATGFEDAIREVKRILPMPTLSTLLDDLQSALAAKDAEIATLQAEMDEQCRIIGMSGEAEARHLAEIAELRGLLEWRDMSVFPPEMEPVICKTEHGTVGIAYCYKLDAEFPQWNFMAMGMNQVGLLNDKARWIPLPPAKLTAALAQNEVCDDRP
jgi:Lar family restriction alleviation protein